jgi:hypothetical protein
MISSFKNEKCYFLFRINALTDCTESTPLEDLTQRKLDSVR